MQVAALEAALQAMCFLYPGQVKKTNVYAKKKFRGKRYKALKNPKKGQPFTYDITAISAGLSRPRRAPQTLKKLVPQCLGFSGQFCWAARHAKANNPRSQAS